MTELEGGLGDAGGSLAARGGATAIAGHGASEGGTVSSSGNTQVSTLAAALAGCEAWPASKLIPNVGPVFHGPTPGPCTSTWGDGGHQQTYSYDPDGLLSSYDNPLVSAPHFQLTRQDGKVATIAAMTRDGTVDYVVSYEWGSGYVVETRKGDVTHYELTDNGYPVALTRTTDDDPSLNATGTFVYEGCRLVARYVVYSDGTLAPSGDVANYYDSDGSLTSQYYAVEGWTQTFDYSCWEQRQGMGD